MAIDIVYTYRIDDVKTLGYGGACQKCYKHVQKLEQVDFVGPNSDWTLNTRRICAECLKGIAENKQFNALNQEAQKR